MSDDHRPKLTLLSVRWPRRRYLLAFALTLAFAAGAALDRYVLFFGVPSNSVADFRLMAEAWNVIHRYYVDRGALQHSAMTAGAINGMTDALGDTGHSTYLSRKMLSRANDAVHGRLIGIGVEVQMKDRQVVIVAPLDDSPAQHAGVHPGDIILEVDHQSVADLPMNQIVTRMSGHPGTTVVLTLLNPKNGGKRDLTIPRAVINMQNVAWQRLPGTSLAHLRVGMFSEGAGGEVRKAILQIKR